MNSFWIALAIVLLLRGVPASVRTFRNQMADHQNVWLFAACAGVIAFGLLR
jgi:hypothetical protein